MKKLLASLLLLVSTATMAHTHTHITPQSHLDCLAKHEALPDEDFPILHWNIDEQLQFMNEARIDCSVFAHNTNIERKATDYNPMQPQIHKIIPDSTMIVRISEIEVHPEHLKEYLEFAHNVGATSVREEPGVICIYPMQQLQNPSQIRILEIYASQEAYQHHIQTPHFQTYKQGTLHMVKSLNLVDMKQMAPETLPLIFNKAK